MNDLYETLKAEIKKRLDARTKESRDSDGYDVILRAQGAARELEQLSSFIDLMENPPKEEKISQES